MSFLVQITADVSGFSRGIDQAEKEIDGLQKAVDENLDKIGKSFEKIGRKMSVFTAAFTLAAGKAYSMAADFQDAIGATEQVFKESSNYIKDWANNLSPDYGVAKKEALEYSNMMGSLLKNLGSLTVEEASKQSSALVELAGDLAAMYGGTVSEAVTALTGGLRGINVMLNKYGIGINEALTKTKAISMGLAEEGKELTIAARQAATLALIMEQSSDAQGQAAREADSASGTMRSFRAEVQNLATEFGQVLLPIITPIIARIRDFVSMLRTMSPEFQSIILGIGALMASIGPLLLTLGKLISFAKFLPELKIAFAALTGPIGIAVAAIAGTAALIISNWDSIKAYFTTGEGSETFNTIKEIAADVKNGVVRVFQDLKTLATRIWDAIGKDVILIATSIVRDITTVIETIVKTFKNVATILNGIFTLDFRTALEGLKNLFIDIFNGISRIVLNNVAKLSSHLSTFFNWVGLEKWANGLQTFSETITNSLNAVSGATGDATQKTEEQATVVKKLTNSYADLNETQKFVFKDGNDVYGLVRKTSDEIVVLTERLKGMRNGAIEVKNVHAEIEKVETRVKGLKDALNTLTGNREINLKLKVENPIEAWEDTKWYKRSAEITSKLQVIPEIDPKLVQDQTKKLLDETGKVITLDLGGLINNGITNLMQNIGNAMTQGGNILDSIGKGIIATVGGIAQQLGAQMIAFGTAGIALQKLMMNPYLAIAAGAALIALGAAASTAANKTVNGGGSYAGGVSSYNNITTPGTSDLKGPYSGDFQVEFVIQGDNLIGVLNTAEQKKRRV